MHSESSRIARTVRPPSSLGAEVAFSTSLNLEAARNENIWRCVWIVRPWDWVSAYLSGPIKMVLGSA